MIRSQKYFKMTIRSSVVQVCQKFVQPESKWRTFVAQYHLANPYFTFMLSITTNYSKLNFNTVFNKET